MTSAGSLDTNVLIRLILDDDPGQHAACQRLYHGATQKLVVADIAVIEGVFALIMHYDYTRQQAVFVMTGLLELEKLICNRALFNPVLELFSQHPKLSFEDCYLSVYAELNQAEPLWTFDKKLANQAPSAQLVA